MSHDSNGPFDCKSPPYPTVQHELPTPTAHPELKQHTYKGCRVLYKPPQVAMSNCRDTPPTWHHPQPVISDAQPPTHLQLKLNMYNTASNLDSHIVTPQNGFEVVHGFSHQNEKVYSIPNLLSTGQTHIKNPTSFYHLNFSSFKDYNNTPLNSLFITCSGSMTNSTMCWPSKIPTKQLWIAHDSSEMPSNLSGS